MLLALAITVFYYAMNLSNIQIILKDGMAARAKVIMGMDEDGTLLNRYFQSACLAADEDLVQAQNDNSPYKDYTVRGIDHRLEMGFLWTWPWDSSVRLKITERIPRIDGRVKGSRADEVIARDGAGALYPPDWKDAVYWVTLTRENGQWKIKSLTLIDEQAK